MKDKKNFWVGVLIFFLIFLLMFTVFHWTVKPDFHGHYRRGQIDALSGNVKYELQVMPDSTRAWMEK